MPAAVVQETLDRLRSCTIAFSLNASARRTDGRLRQVDRAVVKGPYKEPPMMQRLDFGLSPDPVAVETVHYGGHRGKAADGAKARPGATPSGSRHTGRRAGQAYAAPRIPYPLYHRTFVAAKKSSSGMPWRSNPSSTPTAFEAGKALDILRTIASDRSQAELARAVTGSPQDGSGCTGRL